MVRHVQELDRFRAMFDAAERERAAELSAVGRMEGLSTPLAAEEAAVAEPKGARGSGPMSEKK